MQRLCDVSNELNSSKDLNSFKTLYPSLSDGYSTFEMCVGFIRRCSVTQNYMHKLQVLLIKLFFDNSRFSLGAESSFIYPTYSIRRVKFVV